MDRGVTGPGTVVIQGMGVRGADRARAAETFGEDERSSVGVM